MSKIGNSVKPRRLIFSLIILIMGIAGYFMFYYYTYSTLGITTEKVKLLEYGTDDYNLKKFILNSNGTILSIKDFVNTTKIGKHKVNVVLNKYNVTRTVTFYVDVVDKNAPNISLKEDTINIVEGEEYNIFDNIVSVYDDVDGDIPFKNNDSIQLSDTYYYTINTNFDYNTSGSYLVEVTAVDKANNISTTTYTINVEKAQVIYREIAYVTNPGSNNSGSGIVSAAYSLLGSPYVSGGNNPAGFDCSGFVQYLYAINGISVSRSASTQAYDGINISLSNASPGDIIVWGYNYGAITHSSVYVGNGMMIHAANPSMGVILSDVSDWLNRSGTTILYVRRIVS